MLPSIGLLLLLPEGDNLADFGDRSLTLALSLRRYQPASNGDPGQPEHTTTRGGRHRDFCHGGGITFAAGGHDAKGSWHWRSTA
ncbi:MAG TPA: hypothetical protein VN837_12515 [Chloroflexota bacterium]|nr:hypothetical protein [Chloroflexota bacterium]